MRRSALSYFGVVIGLAALLVVGMVVLVVTAPEPVDEDAGGVVAVLAEGLETHGPDPLPPRPPSSFAEAAPQVPWPCLGDGADGPRVQMVYAHNGTGNLAANRATLESITRSVVGAFAGGDRLLRLVTDSACNLSILDVTVSAQALSSFDVMIREFSALGLNRPDRKYHAWAESSTYCGIGTVSGDDRPGQTNRANAGPSYARSDRPCWNYAEAHEIAHNLGAVQLSAPNSTGGWHTKDALDIMSYADGGPNQGQVTRCPDPVNRDRFDCNADDYFSPSPAAGSYLASHWNLANSTYLASGSPPTTQPPPTTVPPTTTTSSTSTTVGKGNTATDLTITPTRAKVGQDLTAVAAVTGTCRPEGVVSFYVSGKLLHRGPLVEGKATVRMRFSEPGRYRVRAEFPGDSRCAKSDDYLVRVIGT